MSTTTVQQNVLYGLGEGVNVADSNYLTYALRWANAAYRDVFSRYRFKALQVKSVFRTAAGQATYQAPSDFIGFLTLKDESHDVILNQVTPEELLRLDDTTAVTNESTTSSHDTAVSLDQNGMLQYSETVTTVAGTTTYTRDTDYTMDYTNGKITVLSTGSMSDATEYYIDYLYRTDSKPTHFAIEYDATNAKYVFRLYPCPDAIYIFSLLYPAQPSALSGSVDSVWSQFEYCLERGGVYFGALEIIQDPQMRMEFKQNYEVAVQALIQLDQDLVPKNDRIPVRMRRTDYSDSYDYRDRER